MFTKCVENSDSVVSKRIVNIGRLTFPVVEEDFPVVTCEPEVEDKVLDVEEATIVELDEIETLAVVAGATEDADVELIVVGVATLVVLGVNDPDVIDADEALDVVIFLVVGVGALEVVAIPDVRGADWDVVTGLRLVVTDPVVGVGALDVVATSEAEVTLFVVEEREVVDMDVVTGENDLVVGVGTRPVVGVGTWEEVTTAVVLDPVVGVGTTPVVGVGTLPVVGVGTRPVVGVGTTAVVLDPVVGVGIAPVVGVGTRPVVGVGTLPVVGVGTRPVVAAGGGEGGVGGE